MGAISYLLLVLFLSQHEMFGADAVQIYLDPAKGISTMVEAIHISCVPDNLDDYVNGVTLIELSRNDQDPLSYVHCGNVSLGEDSSGFQAVAKISKDPSQSYLNVSLMNPVSDDTGIYTCSLHYIDTSGHMKMETASANLLIENIDVKSIERVFNQMRDKITFLMEENKKSSKLIPSLEEKVTSLDKENKDLREKMFYTVAFTTTTKKRFTPSDGSVIILPDVVWSVGTGYDKSTGVFTAPVPGLYVFHVTIRSKFDCNYFLDFMVREEVLHSMYSYEKDAYPQASISPVVNLMAGDRVYIQMRGGYSCMLNNDDDTFMSGYLIKTY